MTEPCGKPAHIVVQGLDDESISTKNEQILAKSELIGQIARYTNKM